MTATKKVKSYKRDTKPASRLIERAVIVRESSANEATKSFTAVIASENPVERWDELRKEVVKEILLTSGLEFRDGRNQLPIVDSHDRTTTRNVLGSIRNIPVIGDEVVGVPMFARDTDSQDAFYKVLDGHITDFSITADPLEIYEVKRGQVADFQGKRIEGPANVVTRWQPTDASLVAAGADVRSKVRRSYELSKGIARAMTPEAIAQLVAKGMPSDLTDPEQIMAWVLGNLSASEASTAGVEMPEAPEVEMAETEYMPDEEKMTEEREEKPKEEIAMKRAIDTEAIKRAERKRITEIHTLCTKAGIERTVAESWANDGVSLDVVREKVIERMAANATQLGTSVGADVRVTESSDDKFYAAAGSGLVKRAFKVGNFRNQPKEFAAGHEDFERTSLKQIAAMCIERIGVKNVHNIPAPDVARIAMGHRPTMQRYRIERADAYHTTGSFANLLLDAANKTLLAGYEEAPYTWSQWARQAQSVDDFKPINRVRLSEMASPEQVPENQKYPDTRMSDARETYRIEKYGNIFSVSWETVVNDDLDALSRIPAAQGAACRRRQNAAVYGVLTANAAMADTGNLFNTTAQTTAGGHANQSASAAAISVTTLNAGYLAMMTMKGLNSTVVLNIMPEFLIVPAALSATAMEVLGSIARPEVGGSAAGNSNTLNIYGPNGSRQLRLIIEPTLDANSTSIWYLAASNSQVDTVELAFLAGEESPVLETEWGFDNDVYRYKVRQTFGVAAIDYRGLYRNA